MAGLTEPPQPELSSPKSSEDVSADTLPGGPSAVNTSPPPAASHDTPEEGVAMDTPTDLPSEMQNDEPLETVSNSIANENDSPLEIPSTESLPPEVPSTENPPTETPALVDSPQDPSISEQLPDTSTPSTDKIEGVSVEEAVDCAEVAAVDKQGDASAVPAEPRPTPTSQDQTSMATSTPVLDLQALTKVAASVTNTQSDFIPLEDTPLSSIADPDTHEPSSDSDTCEEDIFPNLTQNLSTLELTSQFDQEDLTESHYTNCPNKSTPTLDETLQVTSSTLTPTEHKEADFVPRTKLGKLLKNIPIPSTQGGWSSKGALSNSLPGTDLNLLMNDDSGVPKVFLCGDYREQVGVASCGGEDVNKEESPCEDVEAECEDGLGEKEQNKSDDEKFEGDCEGLSEQSEEENSLSEEDAYDDQSEVEEDVDDFSEPSLNPRTRPAAGRPSATSPAASSGHQIEVIIPDIPCEVSPSLSQQSQKTKLLKYRKITRYVTSDPSPVVVDLRPPTETKSGKRKATVTRPATPYPKRRKSKIIQSEEDSSASVEAVFSTPETVKKGQGLSPMCLCTVCV